MRRTGLTLAGNRRARRALIEGAWTSAHAISETIDARLYFGWQHFARDRRPAVVNIDSAATFLAGPGGEPATGMVSCKRGHVFLHHAAAYIVARGLVFTVVTGAVFSNGASGAISLRIFLTSKTVRSRFDTRGGEQPPSYSQPDGRRWPSRVSSPGIEAV